MKVLFVSAEASPFVQTGGLAEVSYSLPKQLKNKGIDIRTIVPYYSKIIEEKYKKQMKEITSFTVQVGWRNQVTKLFELWHRGAIYYFIDYAYYYDREGIYGYHDDGERFSYFNLAVLEAIQHIPFYPDIIHTNDWHTGFIPLLLKDRYCYKKGYEHIKTVFTIHNLKYQGIFPGVMLGDMFSIDYKYFYSVEFYGKLSFMKAGINFSDVITTVSKTYSKEIQTAYFGEHLEGVLSNRKDDLYGIVNGIDYDVYNTEKNNHIAKLYSIDNIEYKYDNKIILQKALKLPVNKEIPVISMVTRLVEMKGIDLILCVLERLFQENVQLIVLGQGDNVYEEAFRDFANRFSEKLAIQLSYNQGLAHKIYAGSDMFLMPSRFEPCGLGQLIAMHYGTIPIVREIGGLKDTVQSYNDLKKTGNGFSFTNYNADDMLYTIKRALKYYNKKNIWHRLIKNSMSQDFSWNSSAKQYIELYNKLLLEKGTIQD